MSRITSRAFDSNFDDDFRISDTIDIAGEKRMSGRYSPIMFMVKDGVLTEIIHNFNGPAVPWKIAAPQWFINNKEINGAEYKQWLLDNGMDINNLTEEDKQFIMLIWGLT